MADNKPSTLSAVISGIGGFIKGALTGGVVGAATGAAVTGVLALTGVLETGAIFAGAVYTAAAFGLIGSAAGTTTAVVNQRQSASDQDVANAANMAFAQGISVGHDMTVTNPALAEQESKKFRAMVEQQRAALQSVQKTH